jgi:hypothetical protein
MLLGLSGHAPATLQSPACGRPSLQTCVVQTRDVDTGDGNPCLRTFLLPISPAGHMMKKETGGFKDPRQSSVGGTRRCTLGTSAEGPDAASPAP